jgi:hypothetical protein
LEGCIALGMKRHEVLVALESLCMKLRTDLWQEVTVADEKGCDYFVLKTQTEIVARINPETIDGVCHSARIRTNLLAKYQTLFCEEFSRLKLSFERLQPYLEHR